jgi:hypothetical protein
MIDNHILMFGEKMKFPLIFFSYIPMSPIVVLGFNSRSEGE